ncbi:MAG: LLM class F420-dependent oxidoreductase [Acidimicrobiia bacterium]
MQINTLFPSSIFREDPEDALAFAAAAERLGCNRLVLHDHVLGAVRSDRAAPLDGGPYDETTLFHEPFVLSAFLAASTTTLGFGTNVLVLPQRQTALVAKQVMELDLVSRGRFVLGVGIGWNWVEYEALGVPFSRRGARLEEQVHLLRRLWTEPVVDLRGADHRIDRAGIAPRSGRTVPIWFGGLSRAAVDRCARIGDGFMFGIAGPSAEKRARRLLGIAKELGRSPTDVGLDILVDYSDGPSAWEDQVGSWAELGGTHVTLRTSDDTADFLGKRRNGFASAEQHVAALEEFASVVRPLTAAGTSSCADD